MSEKRRRRLQLQHEEATVIKHLTDVLHRLAEAYAQYGDWMRHDADVKRKILDLEEAEG